MKRWSSLIFVFVLSSLSILAQEFPDGLIAYAVGIPCEKQISCSDGINILDPNTGEMTHIDTGHDNVYGETLSWSPNQRYLAYMTYSVLHIYDVQNDEIVGTIEFEYGDYQGWSGVWYDWHPSLPLMAFIYQYDFTQESPPYGLFVFDLTQQEWTPLVTDFYIQPFYVQWAPDGERILFSAREIQNIGESKIYRYEINSQAISPVSENSAFYAEYSSDGREIVLSSRDNDTHRIEIIDATLGQAEIMFEGDDIFIGKTEWVLNDTQILYWANMAESQNNTEFYLLDVTTREVTLVLAIPPHFSGYDLSPDRSALVYLASKAGPKNVCIFSLVTLENTCLDVEKAHHVAYPVWAN